MASAAMAAPAPLCPDKRGGRRVLCHGTFLVMRGGAGWIRPIEEIDHPSMRWNKGNIYLAEADIRKGTELEVGDSVVFYLYVDAKGLGAEDCTQVWNQHQVRTSPATEAPNSVSVNLVQFFADDDSEGFSDSDKENNTPKLTEIFAKPTEICLAKALPEGEEAPAELPSAGSALHAEGMCKRCSFFPKGKCTNGADCEFCHFEHDKRPKRHKRKNKKAQAQEEVDEDDADDSPVNFAEAEPIKLSPSAFLQEFSKSLFSGTPGDSTPTTSADEGSWERCADLSDSSTCAGSPAPLERDPCLVVGAFKAPPGLPPPMPGFLPVPTGRVLA